MSTAAIAWRGLVKLYDRERNASMADVFTPQKRSSVMAAIRSSDTKPEVRVRKALHKHGMRYRLHRKDLPGRPDIVFPKQKVAIFVHGCFWHRHGCALSSNPKSRQDYWTEKFARNVERDAQVVESLSAAGWSAITVWECETRKANTLSQAIERIVNTVRSRSACG